MAEADAEHSRKKEGYKQESLQQSQINEAEAQRRINQVKQQAQQEAHQYVRKVVNFAEQANISKLREERATAEANADAKSSSGRKTSKKRIYK